MLLFSKSWRTYRRPQGSLEHGMKTTDKSSLSGVLGFWVITGHYLIFHKVRLKTQGHCHHVSQSKIKTTQGHWSISQHFTAFHWLKWNKRELALCVGKRKDGAEKGLGPVFYSEPWSFGSSLWRFSTNWVTPEKSPPVFGLKSPHSQKSLPLSV